MENLKIGEKITKVPLIQGGMGVGISLGRLAGSVAKAGGIGVISTAQIGYREPDFDKHPEEANLRAIGKEMQKARQISENGIIGYNIMTALKGYADHVKAAVKAGADLIISGAGLPVDLPALTEGSAVKIAPIVSTARSAQVILKYWDKKYGRTADLIVAEGPLAGGHLGLKTVTGLHGATVITDLLSVSVIHSISRNSISVRMPSFHLTVTAYCSRRKLTVSMPC